jgi:hypothetical protein
MECFLKDVNVRLFKLKSTSLTQETTTFVTYVSLSDTCGSHDADVRCEMCVSQDSSASDIRVEAAGLPGSSTFLHDVINQTTDSRLQFL